MRIALFGATGRMGQAITHLAKHDDIIPFSPSSLDDYIHEAKRLEADVAIDVSDVDAIELHLSTCVNRNIPLVIGTTGLGPDHIDAIEEASQSIPVFRASNFSLGIALLKSMLTHISNYMEGAYVDIIEKHAATKKDAPSGTAIELAQIFTSKEVSSEAAPRETDHIHINSIRSSGYSFNHDVLISYGAEELKLGHTCYNRHVFADGALQAAHFLKEQTPGLYTMDDLIKHVKVRL